MRLSALVFLFLAKGDCAIARSGAGEASDRAVFFANQICLKVILPSSPFFQTYQT
jgi:hypothetical protein